MSIAFPVCPQRGCRGSHALRGDAAHPGKAHPSVDRLHAVVKTLAETPHLVNYPLETATGHILSRYWFEIGSCLRFSLVLHSQFPDTPLMASDYVIDTEDFRGDLPQGTSPMLFNRYAQNGR